MVWFSNGIQKLVIFVRVSSVFALKNGHFCLVFKWYELNTKMSGLRMNPVFKCPVFGSSKYSGDLNTGHPNTRIPNFEWSYQSHEQNLENSERFSVSHFFSPI